MRFKWCICELKFVLIYFSKLEFTLSIFSKYIYIYVICNNLLFKRFLYCLCNFSLISIKNLLDFSNRKCLNKLVWWLIFSQNKNVTYRRNDYLVNSTNGNNLHYFFFVTSMIKIKIKSKRFGYVYRYYKVNVNLSCRYMS